MKTWIKIRYYEHCKKYFARIYHERKSFTRQFSTEQEAKEWLSKMEHAIENGEANGIMCPVCEKFYERTAEHWYIDDKKFCYDTCKYCVERKIKEQNDAMANGNAEIILRRWNRCTKKKWSAAK